MRKVLVVIWLVVGARLRPAFGPNALVSKSVGRAVGSGYTTYLEVFQSELVCVVTSDNAGGIYGHGGEMGV